MRRVLLGSLAIVLLAAAVPAGCGPFVEVVKVDQAEADRLRAQIATYESEKLAAGSYKVLQPIEATSCKLMLWDPPATEQDAIDQLRTKAAKLDANGLMNMSCGAKQGTSLGKNCWESITCNAAAIHVAR